MDTITPAVSPLRQRMTEDMRMRKLEPKTLDAYIRAVIWRPHRSVAAHLLWGWYGAVKRGEAALEEHPA